MTKRDRDRAFLKRVGPLQLGHEDLNIGVEEVVAGRGVRVATVSCRFPASLSEKIGGPKLETQTPD